ncbi:MAG: polysaccharide deacetylase family protein [Clostridia bacterium]
MRKSQIITLILLFIAVSLFIWIGACSDKKSNTTDPGATIKINSPGTGDATPGPEGGTPAPEATPTAEPGVTKPTVDFTQVEGLKTGELALDVSFTDYVFTDAATKSVMDQSTYILSKPGADSKDIYMSFLLHYSEANPKVTKLLDLAKEKNVKFTFYLSSMYLNDEQNLDIIKRMHDEGHTIGTRGDKSIDPLAVSPNALYDSFWAMETKYQSIFGAQERMYFYAPDKVSERNMKLANLMGYTVTFKLCNFVTNAGSQPQTYNGIVFQSSDLTDGLITEVTGYVEWGQSQGYTFKNFTK